MKIISELSFYELTYIVEFPPFTRLKGKGPHRTPTTTKRWKKGSPDCRNNGCVSLFVHIRVIILKRISPRLHYECEDYVCCDCEW